MGIYQILHKQLLLKMRALPSEYSLEMSRGFSQVLGSLYFETKPLVFTALLG